MGSCVGNQYPGIIPSVVTLAGAPVAMQGDLVYLGGGMFASASAARLGPASDRESSTQRRPANPQKVLPGRVNRPPPRPAMRRSAALRSASAQLVGRPRMCVDNDSPKAQSDGNPFDDDSGAGGRATDKSAAAVRAWRPSGHGGTLRPKAEDAPPRPKVMARDASGGPPGSYSEARADARASAWRDAQDVNLYGAQGILSQLTDPSPFGCNSAQDTSAALPLKTTGPPRNGDRRKEERLALKEAKVQALLEERAIRLAAEAPPKRPNRSHSAALISTVRHSTDDNDVSYDEAQRQKLRIACKMQMVDFFNGYSSNINQMSADQASSMLTKLHGNGSDPTGLAVTMMECGEEQASEQADNKQSIHRKLQQVSDLCNQMFEVSTPCTP